MMKKIIVFYRTYYQQYVGCGDTLEAKRKDGIASFDTTKEVDAFLEDQTVSYGEEGGRFETVLFYVDSDANEKTKIPSFEDNDSLEGEFYTPKQFYECFIKEVYD